MSVGLDSRLKGRVLTTAVWTIFWAAVSFDLLYAHASILVITLHMSPIVIISGKSWFVLLLPPPSWPITIHQPYIRTRLVTEAKARSPFLRDSWTVRLSSNSNSVRSCRLEVRFVRMYQIRADSTSASSSLRVLKTFPLPGFIHSFNMNQPASRTGINRFPGAQDARRPREQRHAESYLAFSQFHDYLGLTRVIEEMTGYQSKDNIATSWYNGYDSDWHGNTPQRLRAREFLLSSIPPSPAAFPDSRAPPVSRPNVKLLTTSTCTMKPVDINIVPALWVRVPPSLNCVYFAERTAQRQAFTAVTAWRRLAGESFVQSSERTSVRFVLLRVTTLTQWATANSTQMDGVNAFRDHIQNMVLCETPVVNSREFTPHDRHNAILRFTCNDKSSEDLNF